MPFESPLKRYAYEAGALIQACPGCDWAQDGHLKELKRCPNCDADLGKHVAIHFGGILVIYNGVDFNVHSRSGGFVQIERADYADAIAFMCRHATDNRADPYWGKPNVRRIRNAKDFGLTCMQVWRRP